MGDEREVFRLLFVRRGQMSRSFRASEVGMLWATIGVLSACGSGSSGSGGYAYDGGVVVLPEAGATSGVNDSKLLNGLTPSELVTICDWRAARFGGYGRTVTCGNIQESSSPSQSSCVDSAAQIPSSCGATVLTFQNCVNAVVGGCTGGIADCAEIAECK